MKSFWKKQYKKLLGFIIAPISFGFIILLLSYPKGIFSGQIITYVLIYSYLLGVPFIAGSETITYYLDKKISWLKNPLKRFALNVIFEVLLMLAVIGIVHYFFLYRIKGAAISDVYERTLNAIIYATVFITGSIIFKNTIFFFRNWKQAAVNEEKLKQEILAVEFEALKNQVNPHFLFNNLTALSSLVYTDQAKAVRYIDQLAEIYRYILEYGKEEVVSLATEKKLLNNIIYLYGIRYEEGLNITLDLPDGENRFVVPMALQILLENAIKHNSLSSEKPLLVKINSDGDYISVWNNLQPKTVIQPSNKLGLKNIRSRYKYLTEKDVIVEETNDYFLVKIPILKTKP
jgi:sensor histidine kinase YesM